MLGAGMFLPARGRGTLCRQQRTGLHSLCEQQTFRLSHRICASAVLLFKTSPTSRQATPPGLAVALSGRSFPARDANWGRSSLPGQDLGKCSRGSQPPLVALAKCWRRSLETAWAPKPGRRLQTGDSSELPSPILLPVLGSPCQALGVSRKRNCGHH